jgi:glycosyltransferase involved in cell wall biosynthesis
MRILVATWSSRLVGGTETYLARILPRLGSNANELGFFYETDEPAGRPHIPLPEGSTSFYPAVGRDERLRAVRTWRPSVIYVHGLLDPAVEERLLEIAPAVFFAHGYYGTCISGDKTHKFPVVQPCTREFGPACLGLFYPRRCGGLNPITMAREYNKQRQRLSLLPRYAAVITASEHMRREFVRHGAAGGRVFACPFSQAGAQASGPSPPDAATVRPSWRLTFVGRMDRLKGGAYLLDALTRVRDAIDRPLHLTFAGDGPDRGRWERHALQVMRDTPGVQIEFDGWLQRPQLDSILERSDLLVMPSLWPEPYGLVGAEATRRGLPVVAFATGGIPEWLVEGVNGCLAPSDPPTVHGLSEAIVRCLGRLSSKEPVPRSLTAGDSELDDGHVAAVVEVIEQAAAYPVSAAAHAHG